MQVLTILGLLSSFRKLNMTNKEPISPVQYLMVKENIRLRPVGLDDVDIAMPWYQDMEVLKYTAGIERNIPYDRETVKSMYHYLMNIGECYIIEVKEKSSWIPVGDVTLSEETIPIVIGKKEYWGRGIAKQVLLYLIRRAKDIGYTRIRAKEIYDYNYRSLNLFNSLGFTEVRKTEHGIEMELRFK